MAKNHIASFNSKITENSILLSKSTTGYKKNSRTKRILRTLKTGGKLLFQREVSDSTIAPLKIKARRICWFTARGTKWPISTLATLLETSSPTSSDSTLVTQKNPRSFYSSNYTVKNIQITVGWTLGSHVIVPWSEEDQHQPHRMIPPSMLLLTRKKWMQKAIQKKFSKLLRNSINR